MSTTAPSKTILIGDLLVRSEMTSPRDMADAVPIALKSNLPIGRVLIAAGALTPGHLQQALVAQSLVRDSLLSVDLAVQALRIVKRESFDLEQALHIVGWHPETFTSENRLGQLLLHAGCVTQEQLEECLRIFYSAGLPLARVLVLKGLISNLVAYVALTSQQMLRENKLSREQAIQSVQAAKASRAVIESDYIDGYLRLQPTNNIRLGELFVRANIVAEEALLTAVEAAIKQGATLGEILIERGLITETTLQRALEAQRLVTEGHLDVGQAGDILRKADHKRSSIKEIMLKLVATNPIKQADPVGAQPKEPEEKPAEPQQAAKQSLPTIPKPLDTDTYEFEFHGGKRRTPENEWHITGPIETRFGPTDEVVETRLLPEVAELIEKGIFPPLASQNKRRTTEETQVRELLERLHQKLEALNGRNGYLANMLGEGNMPALRITAEPTNESLEQVKDFESAMEFIERLFGQVETSSYRNGYLLSRIDGLGVEASLKEKLKSTEQLLDDVQTRLAQVERKWQDSDNKLRQTLCRLSEAEERLRELHAADSGKTLFQPPKDSADATDRLADVISAAKIAAVRSGQSTKTTVTTGNFGEAPLAFTIPMLADQPGALPQPFSKAPPPRDDKHSEEARKTLTRLKPRSKKR